MKNQIQILLILLISCTATLPLQSQDLHVYYNLFNDSVTYFSNEKLLKTPRLRKGDAVQLHLTEFNPFIHDIELKVEETTKADGGGASGLAAMSSFMPGLPGGFMGGSEGGEPSAGSGSGLPFLDIPLLTINDTPVTLKSIFENSRGSEALIDQASLTMKEITVITEEIRLTHAALKNSEKALRVSRLAIANVDKIKYHSGIKPSLVKKMCGEYYAALFQTAPSKELSLDDLLGWQDLPAQHEMLFQKLKTKQGELAAKVSLLQSFSDQVSTLGIEDAGLQKYSRDLIDFQAKARTLNAQLKDGFPKTASLSNLPSIQELADLQLNLAEVISNDFIWRSTVQPTADEINLTFRVLQKRDSAAAEEPTLVKERSLRIEARGGLKVTASVGVTFGQFFSPGQSYSVNDGFIVGEDDGAFSPSIASFLHFHGYRGQRATLGGSFGVGFPVLANGENQSIQFFLGPSLVLGASQKLILSGGFMGGRVQRLAKGFRVGDAFDANNGDIPTVGKYELGAFVGLSFNLGN